VVYWIYKAAVKPIVTYAATIWWPRVKLKTSQAELSKLQRMTCLGITGAMISAPTAAMAILLGLPPLHLQMDAEAKVSNYRLRCNEQWRPESEGFGHAYMIQDMKKEHILQMGSDKMILKHVYDKPFTIRFPERSEWKEGTNLVHRRFQEKQRHWS
jgi:hypothetical protein